MSVITLAEAKAHLRVTNTDDDTYLQGLIDATEAYVSKVGVAVAAPIDAPVRQACYLLISHFNEHREAATDAPPKAIAYGVDALLSPYRAWEV
ncbi:head-tail connector protein [Mesorhizobium sp. M0701]|uniref:head-tail connector protein n=1 Tax=Mesorhizobium sp. M0701 TaxID=2956989 RepID=UPI00333AC21F